MALRVLFSKFEKNKMLADTPSQPPKRIRTKVFNEEPKHSPKNPVENGQNVDCIFSPRFKSLAAMAGWDEEALLVASLVVEDTPDRESKCRKCSDSQFKTPPSNSRRKRRAQRRSPTSIPVAVLDLDEEETSRKENVKKKSEVKAAPNDKEKIGAKESPEQKSRVSYPSLDLSRDLLSTGHHSSWTQFLQEMIKIHSR